MPASPSTFIDKTINTSKGDLRIVIDMTDFYVDLDHYMMMLISARNIPFDLDNISSGDQAIFFASEKFAWASPQEVLQAVLKHYESQTSRTRREALVLTATKSNPTFSFEPKPYDPPRAPSGDWDVVIPAPVINLRHPLERRLKQVYDMIGDSPETVREFDGMMQTIFIEAERRLREVDPDGFQSGSTGRSQHPQNVSSGLQSEATPTSPSLGSVRGGHGNLKSKK